MKKNAERIENGGEISHCSKCVFATAVSSEISNFYNANISKKYRDLQKCKIFHVTLFANEYEVSHYG